MKTIKIFISFFFTATCAMASSDTNTLTLKITNPSTADRNGEVVEISDCSQSDLKSQGVVVKDSKGQTIPSQITFDGRLLVFGDFPAQSTTEYKVSFIPSNFSETTDTICIGQIRHDMQDDYTWENDRSGYRLYGPSYR
ncbi:MAG: DUF4861 domain-containing protein, partial [Muribaculaceae bacterium]|nr:DUF4861 domain-containing protein [Muribaculaceae bacterium]